VKRRQIVSAALAFVASMSLAGSAFAFSGASNGSFEDGTFTGNPFDTLVPGSTALAGWTIESGSIDWIGSYWTASQGSRSIDLTGFDAGAISQTLTTTIGNTYVVTFDLSGNPAGPPTIKTLTVGATGAPTTGYTFDTLAAGNTLDDMKWVSQTYTFLATSTSSVLTFTSTTAGFYGPALDNVTVTENVPTAADCKNGGWATMIDTQGNGFKNQGDCVSFFATKGKNLGAVAPVSVAAPATAATGDASRSSVADVKRAAVKRPAHTHVRTHGNATKVQADRSATKGQANGAAGHH
jgi:choice-of-anchor C domain-containing protein